MEALRKELSEGSGSKRPAGRALSAFASNSSVTISTRLLRAARCSGMWPQRRDGGGASGLEGWRAMQREGRREEEEKGEEGAAGVRKLQERIWGEWTKTMEEGGEEHQNGPNSITRESQGKQTEKPQQHMLGAPADISSILTGRAGEHKGSLYMSERGGLRPEAYKKHRIKLPASSCQGAWKVRTFRRAPKRNVPSGGPWLLQCPPAACHACSVCPFFRGI